jgi:WD40 repeat protein
MCKWNCDTGLLVGKPWKGEGRCIWALALSPDGRTIACGRGDGRVQQRNTNGEMIEGVWTGYSGDVRSLSWSPTGSHLACGCEDGTILIRKANSGEVVVGPIETDQGRVRSLAYSPSGDRIASGGDKNICIWDSNTGKLLVRPIEDPGNTVTSVVWSSDSSKLYSASDEFARVFDNVSGTLLHRFPHHDSLWSVALSPKHNVLACVGDKGAAQLWDMETYEPLGPPFRQDGNTYFVSFSPDGRYLITTICRWIWWSILASRRNVLDQGQHSDWSIQGSWNKSLDKICFSCGHYYEDVQGENARGFRLDAFFVIS